MENTVILRKHCPHCGIKHIAVAHSTNQPGEDKTAPRLDLAAVYAELIKEVDQCEKRIKGGQLNLPDIE